MDDQAARLRQLVRTVRQAAESATTGPLVLLVAAGDIPPARRVAEQIERQIAAQPEAPWHLARLFGPYRSRDRQLWQSAAAVVAIFSPDDDGVLATYTALKLAAAQAPLPPVELVVLGGAHTAATQAAERLRTTCQRFLQCQPRGTTRAATDGKVSESAVAELLQRFAAAPSVARVGGRSSPLATIEA